MTRHLMSLIAVTGLTFGLGLTPDAKAQFSVVIGNPYTGGGFYLNSAPALGSYNSYYGGAPTVPYYGGYGYGYGYGNGYAPNAYAAPGFSGYAPSVYAAPSVYGYAPPVYAAPSVYGYAPRYYQRGFRGFRW